jgi:hypothetical protein
MGRWHYEPYDEDDDYRPRRNRPRVEIPPGVDPIRIMEFMDRVQRRKSKEPKKEEKKKELAKEALWYFQAACILYFLSPPIAALHQLIATLTTSALK